MEAPIYRLEGVVKAKEENMEDFVGPLDLILHLLSKNKLEIKDIQIALILDQYMEWMNKRKELDLEVASDFVTMASHLVYIKTRMLLSINDEEAMSEMEQLIATLEAHQRNENYLKVKAVVPALDSRYQIGRVQGQPQPVGGGGHLPGGAGAVQGAPAASGGYRDGLHCHLYPGGGHSGVYSGELLGNFFPLWGRWPEGPEKALSVTACGGDSSPKGGARGRGGEVVEVKELESALEGVLFAAGEPVAVERLCLGLEVDRPTLDAVAQRLMDQYSYDRRGIRLVKLDTSYQLCSAPEFASYIRKTLESRKPAKLSQPALEVLAIIAYYQPVTRAYVDQVRGVDSSYTMGLLLERELIEEAGRLAVPGRPMQFKTTKNFLRSFGLSSLEELPELPNQSQEGSQMTLELEASLQRLREAEVLEGEPSELPELPAEGT